MVSGTYQTTEGAIQPSVLWWHIMLSSVTFVISNVSMRGESLDQKQLKLTHPLVNKLGESSWSLVLCLASSTYDMVSETPVRGGHRGGTQIWVGQGCAARASKPLPIFKGDFGRKGFFLKTRPIFQKFRDFSGFSPCENPKIWAQSEKLIHV